MKNKLVPTIILALVVVMGYFIWNPTAQESITYFKQDPELKFTEASTVLQLLPSDKLDRYFLQYSSKSVVAESVYLRQDVGVVYLNGALQLATTQWKRNASTISLASKIEEETGGLAEAFTFHHAEEHRTEEDITSIQAISAATAGIVFKKGSSPKQVVVEPTSSWVKEATKRTTTLLDAYQQAHKDRKVANYDVYSLSALASKDFLFPGQTIANNRAIIGRLTEGLYKNIFLPASKKSTASTEGSSLPIILYAKDKTHIIVISKKSNGEWLELRQNIPVQ